MALALPIMVPTMREIPLKSPTVLLRLRLSLLRLMVLPWLSSDSKY